MAKNRQVVAYSRVSTLEQKRKGYGIEIQVRDVTLFAETQGLFIDRFYKDEGKSGTDERRAGLKRLLRDCRAGSVRAVIIPSLDRLSRELRLAENLFWTFERLGVQVLIADMPTYSAQDRRDVLIRQIRGAIAEENRKDIIERLWKGRQERVRRGLPPGGNIPYGYRRHRQSFTCSPEEADIVRTIFERANCSQTMSAIAKVLNGRGKRRRNGKEWTPRQVGAILGRKDLYTQGKVRYGEVSGTNHRLILVGPETRT